MFDTECDKRQDEICLVAAELAGVDAVTNPSACRFCLGCETPKGPNRATVSIAIGAVRDDPEKRAALVAKFGRIIGDKRPRKKGRCKGGKCIVVKVQSK